MASITNKLFGLLDSQSNSTGENGSKMYTRETVDNCPIRASFVDAFNGIMDNMEQAQCKEYVQSINTALEIHSKSFSEEEMSMFYSYLYIFPFMVRDIRNNGKGRRDEFYTIFNTLYEKNPTLMIQLIEIIPEYGYWKDLSQLYLLNYNNTHEIYVNLRNKIVEIYAEQMVQDIQKYKECKGSSDKCELSLCTKWLPKEGRSIDKKTKIYGKICEKVYQSLEQGKMAATTTIHQKKRYVRQNMAPIQDAINTTEKLECTNRFDEIQFKFVPGRTMFKKKLAYLYTDKLGNERGNNETRLRCRQNLLDFIELAKKGKVEVKGKTMFIHELCQHIMNNSYLSDSEKDIINEQYKSHLEHFRKIMVEKDVKLNKGVVLADFSGSMAGDPMNAAMAIAILISDLSTTPWNDRFISFESNPQWIKLSYPDSEREFLKNFRTPYDSTKTGQSLTFCEKVQICKNSPWGGSTDFMKAHDLILNIATHHNLSKEDMPEWFICASDMQFDASQTNGGCSYYAHTSEQNQSTSDWDDNHTLLTKKYEDAGYTLPQMIYWNLRDTGKMVTQSNRKGVQMLSGFSTMQLTNFLETLTISDITPWDTFLETINHPCFDMIKKKLNNIEDKTLTKYVLNIDKTITEGIITEMSSNTLDETIQNLDKLFSEGALTKEDYEKIKKQLSDSSVIIFE